ncbi:hypothetical protein Vretimale_8845 [Volvox reticuliferus]|uniref:Alpha-amylase n=1 Tax=Volvox reticuliferus TaxID=1737510 RepID=A0A8J4LN57_9CHLO|nr:hypothetical protein Vretifemale_6145 [Volvox reticuliferus]GIM04266.1 hypothetical protein Vretimale_8845 [Volvox reticuliferus]
MALVYRRHGDALAISQRASRHSTRCRPRMNMQRLLVVKAQAPPFLGASDPVPADARACEAPSKSVIRSGQGYSDAILLQGFAWDSWKQGDGDWYGKVKAHIPDMQALGVTHVWLPPPSHSVSPEGYLPGQLYDLTSKYGNLEQLKDLTAALQAAGISPMADIVINHRCADEQENGVYNSFKDQVDHEGASIDWGRWAITSNDPHFNGAGNPDTGADFPAAPDLDHANPELRAALKDWLSWLQRDVGFRGWRFDYVRGYDAKFISEYVDATTGIDSFNVGEYWTEAQWSGPHLEYNQDWARQTLCDWVDRCNERCCAFDFPTKSILQEAARNCQYDRLRDGEGKAPGLMGWWPAKAVTFVDNHDTGSTQQHWPFPSDHVGLGYAYILTHPGIPCLFWDHVFVWGKDLREQISALTALRRRCGVVNDSSLTVVAAEADVYVAKVDGRFGSLILKLGPRMELGGLQPAQNDGWALAAWGGDWAVWEKSTTPPPPPLPAQE